MNILYLTQSSSLDLFYGLMKAMARHGQARHGFYATDSRFFGKFSGQHPELASPGQLILKEWEIIREAKSAVLDLPLLRRYEGQLGQPVLWNALVADRRIFWGKKYQYAQDHQSPFTHEQMMAILQTGLKRVEALFDDLKPSLVVGFQCTTLGDYLAHLFAKARGIPLLNLRPIRIRNFFYAGEDVLEPSADLQRDYEALLRGGIPPALEQEARRYLEEAQNVHALYEGVILPANTPPKIHKRAGGRKRSILGRVIDSAAMEAQIRFGRYRDDNSVPSHWDSLFHHKIVRPLRARAMAKKFRDLYATKESLPSLDYAFFPLHTEPEVTLSVYSKPYLNQIEAVRLVSHNLPVGMKLVVKEHPWSVGKRPISYYERLLEIPNVILAEPSLTSRELITHSRLVAVIAGSIAFEAVLMRKPALTLGRAPFNFLPPSMFLHNENPDRLGHDIRTLLEGYAYDEKPLLAYIAAAMRSSVAVDFYTKLLGRQGAFSPGGAPADGDREAQINKLADYLEKRYHHFTGQPRAHAGAGLA